MIKIPEVGYDEAFSVVRDVAEDVSAADSRVVWTLNAAIGYSLSGESSHAERFKLP